MSEQFFNQPILNSPYECPNQHWELDDAGQPTQKILNIRRPAKFVSFVPGPKGDRGSTGRQAALVFDATARGIGTGNQQYDLTEIIESLRHHVGNWRALPKSKWRVTPETAELLQHWRLQRQSGEFRPFFCQVEAVETFIWLTEVAPALGNTGRQFLDYLLRVNEQANPGLPRLALKLATGAGKTGCYGDANCLADYQRGPSSKQSEVHPRLPGRHAWHHHQRPPAGTTAERSG